MINSVQLTGTVTDGYQGRPAVREITGKTGGTLGYSLQIEFSPASGGRAFVDVTVWNPGSAAKQLVAGDAIQVSGALDQDSWQTEEGSWRRKLTLQAVAISCQRLFEQAATGAA